MSSGLEALKIACNLRKSVGTLDAKVLRKNGLIPVVLYGHVGPSVALSLNGKEFALLRKTNGRVKNRLFELDVDGVATHAVLKEVQQHVVTDEIIHMDFQKVDASSRIKVDVTINIVGEDTCQGLKSGGVLNVILRSIKLLCSPLNMPPAIEVDVSAVTIGHSIHVGDLSLPAGTELPSNTDNDAPVVSVVPQSSGGEGEGEDKA